MRYETAIRRQIPAAACVARFWAQPPKSSNALHCCSRPMALALAMERTPVPPPPTPLHRIMFCPTPPFQNRIRSLAFFGGYLRQNKGAHHEHQKGLGAEKPATKRQEATWKDPLAEKRAAIRRGKCIWQDTPRSHRCARAPPCLGGRACALRSCIKVSIRISEYDMRRK